MVLDIGESRTADAPLVRPDQKVCSHPITTSSAIAHAITGVQFKTALVTSWLFPDHISALDMEAALLL